MSKKNALKPLVDRPTNQLERRTAKIVMRVGRENAITRGWVMGVVEILKRPFIGRMRWLIRGV